MKKKGSFAAPLFFCRNGAAAYVPYGGTVRRTGAGKPMGGFGAFCDGKELYDNV